MRMLINDSFRVSLIRNETTKVKESSPNENTEKLTTDINGNNLTGDVSGDSDIGNYGNAEDLSGDVNGNVEDLSGNDENAEDLTEDVNGNKEDLSGNMDGSDLNTDDFINMENSGDKMEDGGFLFDDMGQGSTVDISVKDPLLSNWGFTIGVTAGVFVFSVVIGILLAKKRIKKGIDLYEN